MIFFIVAVVVLFIAIPFMNKNRKPGNGNADTNEYTNNDAFFTTSASDRYGDAPDSSTSDSTACNDTDSSSDSDSASCDSGDSGGSDGGSSD